MTRALPFLFLALAAAAPLGAQSAEPKKPTSITLTGCVTRDETPGRFTFTDSTDGTKYRLTGKTVRKYVGQQVEIVGGPDTGKVKVVGGLYPSPNAAGQAGALDPTRAAIAAQPGGTSAATGNPELPDFRVMRVRPVAGECPQ